MLLIVDDQAFMRNLIRDALSQDAYDFLEAEDGETAVKLFVQYKPDAVLLDAVMPNMDGFEACRIIRASEAGRHTPILMVTTLGDADSINAGFGSGVSDFIQKPMNMDILRRRLAYMIKEKNIDEKLRQSEERFRLLAENARDCIVIVNLAPFNYDYVSPVIETITGYKAGEFICDPMLINKIIYEKDRKRTYKMLSDGSAFRRPFEIRVVHKQGHLIYVENQVVPVKTGNDKIIGLHLICRDITERKQEETRRRIELTQKALFETVKALSATIETRDPYTSGHQHRVAELAVAISKELGMDKNGVEGIQTAALLHDIGKITIPAEYLSRPGELSETEFNVIKHHSVVGYEILKPIEFPWPIAQIVYQHHERLDGSGYPRSLSGKQILPETKIVSVADVVEAMSSHRPYRAALGVDKALEEISANLTVKYDNLVGKACLKVFRKHGFSFSVTAGRNPNSVVG